MYLKNKVYDSTLTLKLTSSLGTSHILRSSVTVPTTTAILFSRPGFFMNLMTRANDIGGLFIFDINNRLSIILLNLAFVLRARNLYN